MLEFLAIHGTSYEVFLRNKGIHIPFIFNKNKKENLGFMKAYYINSTEVNKEKFILSIVDAVTKIELTNSVKLRNNTYIEVCKVVDEKSILSDNFTMTVDALTLFHIAEK